MNWRAVRWVSDEGVSGYVAVMLWRSVHEARPRASTSGGQSGGWERGVLKVVPAEDGKALLLPPLLLLLIKADDEVDGDGDGDDAVFVGE